MVCPFRVVIILVSCIVALTAAFFALRQPVELSSSEAESSSNEENESSNSGEKKTWKELFRDFWTGQYLWSYLKPYFGSYVDSEEGEEGQEEEEQAEGEAIPASGDHEE